MRQIKSLCPTASLGLHPFQSARHHSQLEEHHKKYGGRGGSDKGNEMQSYACWEVLALIRMCMYSIYLSLKPINKASALAITDVCRHFTRPLFWWSTCCCKVIFLSSLICICFWWKPLTDFENYDWRGGKGWTSTSETLSKNCSLGTLRCNNRQ